MFLIVFVDGEWSKSIDFKAVGLSLARIAPVATQNLYPLMKSDDAFNDNQSFTRDSDLNLRRRRRIRSMSDLTPRKRNPAKSA